MKVKNISSAYIGQSSSGMAKSNIFDDPKATKIS